MEELGQLQPIILSPTYQLIAGLHRYTVAKNKEWERIAYIIKSYNEIDTELAEIDENLIRFDLTALDRQMQLARREALYKLKYPEDDEEFDMSQWETVDEENPGIRDSEQSTTRRPSFVVDTAAKTGKSTTVIRDETNAGKKLLDLVTPEIRNLISPTKVANNKRELQNLINVPDADTRLEIAEKIHQSYLDNPDNRAKQLGVDEVMTELGKQYTYETVTTVEGHTTLDKALRKTESLLHISVNHPDFKSEVEGWTSEGVMSIREHFFKLDKTVQKGIKILTDVLESNVKLNK
jgi:hypothetical protein